MKKIYMVLIFITIGFLSFFMEIAHVAKKEPNGTLLSTEMAENIWTENKNLYNAEENNKQTFQEQELACENDGNSLNEQELVHQILNS